MSHLRSLGNTISVRFDPDEDGYMGRECPEPECLGYFKITPGTGVLDATACFCPYCGHQDSPDNFFTQEQIEHAKSVALNRITGALLKDLKALEFNHPARGSFGIGMSLTVSGRPAPIRYYREKRLETEVICDACTLRYAIYGVFAFCPDCGAHNSLQILSKNLELVEKKIVLAATVEPDLSAQLVADALENVVAAFDAFGRERCWAHTSRAVGSPRAAEVSFQNLMKARDRVQALFGVDLSAGITADDWTFACRAFQKRHLLAHKMGVVDEAYIRATGDPAAVIGRKVRLDVAEVQRLVAIVGNLGRMFTESLPTSLKQEETTP